jgi:hypothetical protein
MSDTNIVTLPSDAPLPVTTPVTPQAMLGMAVARGDTELASKLMDLVDRWEARQARKSFEAAIANCNFKVIIKNRTMSAGPGRTTYQYEDLAAIADAIGDELSAHGLSYRFRVNSDDPKLVRVTCIIAHCDGYSEEQTMCAPPDTSGSKSGVQAIGSTVTYLQRYSLKSALGLAAAVDDDGTGGRDRVAIKTISDEQVQDLNNMLTETKSNTDKFLDIAGVAAVPDILATQYETLRRMLEQRKVVLNAKGAGNA